MNPQQLMVLAAALNALGITSSSLEDMMPFRVIDLPQTDKIILRSPDITKAQPDVLVKPVQIQRRQPNGKNGRNNF